MPHQNVATHRYLAGKVFWRLASEVSERLPGCDLGNRTLVAALAVDGAVQIFLGLQCLGFSCLLPAITSTIFYLSV